MRTILIFLAGCLFGGILGVFATLFFVAASRTGTKMDEKAEYQRYLSSIGDPRD